MRTYHGEKAIISLTSWKARIDTVAKTIYSLLKMCPGFHIVLVLSEEEFPKKEAELPASLMAFVNNNLVELLWVYKNYKSFKKVLFTMDKYRDVPVISADDDCIYVCNYAEELYQAWLETPQNIITSNGMPAKNYGIPWGRGPNTLYPPCMANYIERIIALVNLVPFYGEDDCFYGVLAERLGISYTDIHRGCFYKFHDTVSPLSAQLPGLNNFIQAYRLLLKKTRF